MRVSRRGLLAAGLVLPFANGANAAEPGAPAVAGPPQAMNFGNLFPLSGPDALVGDECLRGVQMALDDINAAGGLNGRKLLMTATDAYEKVQTEPAAQAAIAGDHAAFFMGSGSSAFSYPGSAAAEVAQLPYFEISAAADGITGRGFRYLLRSCLTTSMIAGVATAAIALRHPGRKIGLLFNTGAEGGAIAAAALAQFGQSKSPVLLSIGYGETVATLHDQVARLQRAGVEVLLHAAAPDDALQLFQAMHDTGWRPAAIFGSGSGYGLRETAEALGGLLDGVMVSAAPFYPKSAQYLADAYQARFDMPPRSADSLNCYVGAKLVFDILHKIGGDPAKLLDALRKLDLPIGTLANGWGVAFDRNGQNTRAFASLQQWQGGMLRPA